MHTFTLSTVGQTGLREQTGPRSDAALCGICSGSTLFATHPAVLDTTGSNCLGQILGKVWKGVKVFEYLW